MICLTTDDIAKLKTMAKNKSFDSNFVSVLLSAVFGDDVLKQSSAGGGISNFNNVSHRAFDAGKLKFIKGNFLYLKE